MVEAISYYHSLLLLCGAMKTGIVSTRIFHEATKLSLFINIIMQMSHLISFPGLFNNSYIMYNQRGLVKEHYAAVRLSKHTFSWKWLAYLFFVVFFTTKWCMVANKEPKLY